MTHAVLVYSIVQQAIDQLTALERLMYRRLSCWSEEAMKASVPAAFFPGVGELGSEYESPQRDQGVGSGGEAPISRQQVVKIMHKYFVY